MPSNYTDEQAVTFGILGAGTCAGENSAHTSSKHVPGVFFISKEYILSYNRQTISKH